MSFGDILGLTAAGDGCSVSPSGEPEGRCSGDSHGRTRSPLKSPRAMCSLTAKERFIVRRMGLGIVRSCCRLLPADAFAQTQVLAELAASDDVHQGAECGVAVGRTWTSGEFGRAWTPMLEVPAARDLTAGPSLRVGLAPQVQVSPCRTTMMAHAYCEGNAMDSPEVPASAEGQVRRVAARARRGGALRQAP